MGYGRTVGMGAEVSERVFVNNKDIYELGVRVPRDSISVGGVDIENDYFQGRNRSHYTLMATTYGLKPVKFKAVVFADHVRDAKLRKSEFESMLYGNPEIYLPDGFYYRCMLEKIGDEAIKGVDGLGVMIECDYQLKGIQHDQMETVVNGASFKAKGTLPRMDCTLTVTVGANASQYELGGAVFNNVVVGDVLVVDGILKRFLKNGAWTTADSWITFPYVVPGANSFTANDTVKVEYYPSYI